MLNLFCALVVGLGVVFGNASHVSAGHLRIGMVGGLELDNKFVAVSEDILKFYLKLQKWQFLIGTEAPKVPEYAWADDDANIALPPFSLHDLTPLEGDRSRLTFTWYGFGVPRELVQNLSICAEKIDREHDLSGWCWSRVLQNYIRTSDSSSVRNIHAIPVEGGHLIDGDMSPRLRFNDTDIFLRGLGGYRRLPASLFGMSGTVRSLLEGGVGRFERQIEQNNTNRSQNGSYPRPKSAGFSTASRNVLRSKITVVGLLRLIGGVGLICCTFWFSGLAVSCS